VSDIGVSPAERTTMITELQAGRKLQATMALYPQAPEIKLFFVAYTSIQQAFPRPVADLDRAVLISPN
jgi:hypothetical protein